ncbi:MAG TPA: hypothetical protein VMW49_09335, partial [Candidatus Dormibacteraeota bacterium]|nr:hypothetical protein [Candidatus Dormibacteraeota bacterium]
MSNLLLGSEPAAAEMEMVQGTSLPSEGPWRSSVRQLSRNRAAMGGLVVLLLVVGVCLLAPVYAHAVA